MSYSFNIKAPNKEAAKHAVMAKFQADILPSNPAHQRDIAAIEANANAVIDLLANDDTKDVAVTCNGYVSWSSGSAEEAKFNTVSINCTASHAARA